MRIVIIGGVAALACWPALSGCIGGSRPAEPLPPPPATTARRAPNPNARMSDLPPDPRANRRAMSSGQSGDVGTTPLPSKPVDGSALNKFFPKGVTFTQEKKGFSMANIQGGTLSITDLASNPSGRDKYKSSADNLGGYPMVTVGNQGVAILVGDRYQVQVRSVAPGKEEWLKKVDLSGLAGLK